MRGCLFIICLGVALCGCRHVEPAQPVVKPEITAVQLVKGRIVQVNARLRYVVIGYYLSSVPEVGDMLGVYRAGKKVGEVKISGPVEGEHVVADITAGEAAVGDDVLRE